MDSVFTVDGHADTLLRVINEEHFDFFSENRDGHLDFPRLQKGRVNLQVMAIFVESGYKPFASLSRTVDMFGAFYRLMEKAPEELEIIRNQKDLEGLYADQEKKGLLLALEGAEALNSISALHTFFELGLRLVTLTWNQRNQLADGVGEDESAGGLTVLGKEMVKEMSRLGVGVDVAHLSQKSFWDLAEFYSGPIIASHSNAYSICPHRRNLRDEQIAAIVESGGIIGMNFSPPFLHTTGKAEIEDVMRHLDYIGERWGFDCLGLGTDYDGIGSTPAGLEEVSTLPRLGKELKARYGEKIMRRIMGENWKRVMMQFLPES